ncbi:MAG: orotidine-5'-phosphate decarboxylase [bacterium]|nr:orotidine-5'-phosphate decarboxylase [bacterium]MDW8164721.1 orotidine-5'-phosphate decarboxylase [Candidatus Omnitrophota bacterium]
MIEKIILSLDLNEKKKIYKLIDETEELIEFYKVGIIPYLLDGKEIIKVLKNKNKKVFLDLKFFDIPNTVKNAAKIVYENRIDMFSVHLMAGKEVIERIVEVKKEVKSETKVIGISILTSYKEEDLKFLSINMCIKDIVEKLAEYGYNWGIDGIVCSGEEIEFLRKKYPPHFLIIVPGIRMKTEKDDQKRVVTAKEALKKGADFIVIGRPIYENPNPKNIILKLKEEIENVKKDVD